ncbi:MAG: hypothetical protein LDLANPLL_00474 [Turneriella sp.]|nr:hypothetical protein [Turneriella sp.]
MGDKYDDRKISREVQDQSRGNTLLRTKGLTAQTGAHRHGLQIVRRESGKNLIVHSKLEKAGLHACRNKIPAILTNCKRRELLDDPYQSAAED